jgi:3-mercaptopyruvate sulfurtransferase SseA
MRAGWSQRARRCSSIAAKLLSGRKRAWLLRLNWKEFLAKNKGKQIIVYCRTGRRSASVANALAAQGVNASNVGGLKDWTDAGLPTRSVGAPKAPPTDPSKK